MDKLNEFLNDLKQLQEKYGIKIYSGYDEEIDYDYEENPYVSGVNSYLVFSDDNGNEVTYEDDYLYKEIFYPEEI